VDCTKSNATQGAKSYPGSPDLHALGKALNPYQQVIGWVGKTLSVLDADGKIPCWGFGDAVGKDEKIAVSFHPSETEYCNGFEGVLEAYKAKIGGIAGGVPTSFAPAVRKAIDVVKGAKGAREFHVCLILTDGQPTNPRDSDAAFAEASKLPIAFVLVGVGDGPWDTLRKMDDAVTAKKFDNVNFVELNTVAEYAKERSISLMAATSQLLLEEVPAAYDTCVKLNYFPKHVVKG